MISQQSERALKAALHPPSCENSPPRSREKAYLGIGISANLRDHLSSVHIGQTAAKIEFSEAVGSASACCNQAGSVIRGAGPSSNINVGSNSPMATSSFQSWIVTAPERISATARVLSSRSMRLT